MSESYTGINVFYGYNLTFIFVKEPEYCPNCQLQDCKKCIFNLYMYVYIQKCKNVKGSNEILDCLTENVSSRCKDCVCWGVCSFIGKDVCSLCPCEERCQICTPTTRKCRPQVEKCKNCIFNIFYAMKMSTGEGPNETLNGIYEKVYGHCKKCICWAVCLFGMMDICNLCGNSNGNSN